MKREINFDEKTGIDVRGPTTERLRHSADAFVIGGEDRGTKIYIFTDSPLQRFYARLRLRAGDRQSEELTKEHTALQKYRHHWYHAGLEASLPSVDLGRVFASDPASMSGMAKSERQVTHRQKYREARDNVIKHEAGIVVDNFVCYEWPLHVACSSAFRGRKIVRDAAQKLAKHWGIG